MENRKAEGHQPHLANRLVPTLPPQRRPQQGSALTHRKSRVGPFAASPDNARVAACRSGVRVVAVGPDDGTVEGRAQSCAEDDRDPLHAGRQGRQGIILDELCRTTGWNRDHARIGTTYGVDPSRRHSTRTSARNIRTEGHCGAGILMGGSGNARRQAPGTDTARVGTTVASVLRTRDRRRHGNAWAVV